jgi:hypothetical protein
MSRSVWHWLRFPMWKTPGIRHRQRHVLASGAEHSLLTIHYDGEGCFRRNGQGEVTHFEYYEFGKHLGIARKVGTSRI